MTAALLDRWWVGIRVLTGRLREVKPVLWVLTVGLLAFMFLLEPF